MQRYLRLILIFFIFFTSGIMHPDEVTNNALATPTRSYRLGAMRFDGEKFVPSDGSLLLPISMRPSQPLIVINSIENKNNETPGYENPQFYEWPEEWNTKPQPIRFTLPEEVADVEVNFIREIQEPGREHRNPQQESPQKTCPGQERFEQSQADSRTFNRRINRANKAWREHMIIGMTTPPAAWLQQQKEIGFADSVLFGQLEFWQIPHYRSMLEKIPAFRVLIQQLAEEISRNPDFMKDGVLGLEYEKYYKKYWQDKLGNGVWGTLIGNIAGMKSHPEDHSKFQRIVQEYDAHYNTMYAAYDQQLQKNKEAALLETEPEADINDPEDSAGYYTPFPADIALPEFDDPQYISHLADQYYGLSGLIPQTAGLLPYRNLILDRAAVLKAAATQSYTKQDHSVNINHQVLAEYQELGHVAQFSGNAVQLRLHSELAAQINAAASFAKANPDNALAANNAPITYAFSSAAATQDNPAAAYHLADACFNLNHLTSMLDAILPQSVKTVGSGVTQGLISSGEHLKCLITSPVSTVINDIAQTGQLVSNSLCAVYAITLGSQEESAAVWNSLANTGQFLSDNPDKAVAMITQMLLPVPGVMAFSNAKRLNLLSKLSNAIKNEHAVSKVITAAGANGEMISFAMQPLSNSTKIMQKSIAAGQKTTAKIAKKVYTTLREEVTDLYRKRMPPVNWKHIYHGEIIGGKPKGMHSEIKQIFTPIQGTEQGPGVFGLYSKNVIKNGVAKPSNFFPKDWSRAKIRQKLREAYKDGILNSQKQTKTSGLLGYTSEGIPIRFWFKTDKRPKIFGGKQTIETYHYINSAYPEFRGINSDGSLIPH